MSLFLSSSLSIEYISPTPQVYTERMTHIRQQLSSIPIAPDTPRGESPMRELMRQDERPARNMPPMPENRQVHHHTLLRNLRRGPRPRPPVPGSPRRLTLHHITNTRKPTPLAETQDTITIDPSTTYDELYKVLRKRAANITFAPADTAPTDVQGLIHVSMWEDDTCLVTHENWVSTQHYLGLASASLTFHFQIVPQKDGSKTGRGNCVQRAKAKVRVWVKGVEALAVRKVHGEMEEGDIALVESGGAPSRRRRLTSWKGRRRAFDI